MEASVTLTLPEIEEIVQWAEALAGDAPEAFAEGGPGDTAYRKVKATASMLREWSS